MKVFTKRNAMIGWATWKVGKRVFGSKPGATGGRSKKTAVAAAAAVATLGGALLYWRRHRESPPEEPGEAQPTPAP